MQSLKRLKIAKCAEQRECIEPDDHRADRSQKQCNLQRIYGNSNLHLRLSEPHQGCQRDDRRDSAMETDVRLRPIRQP